ncbi:MAG: hypothetical protein K6L73_10245 [Cellvibrionaceae bacterium]
MNTILSLANVATTTLIMTAVALPAMSANAEQRSAPAYEVIEENVNAPKAEAPQEIAETSETSQGTAKAAIEKPASEATEATAAEQVAVEDTAEIAVANPQSINYNCNLSNLSRRVSVDFLEPPAAVPCQVNYFKDTEEPGVQKTLWWAENNEGYCERKAEEFVDKLTGLGWECIQ